MDDFGARELLACYARGVFPMADARDDARVFLIDPERQLSVTLLTNRTWPDCKNEAIKEVRPRVHDAIIEALEKSA